MRPRIGIASVGVAWLLLCASAGAQVAKTEPELAAEDFAIFPWGETPPDRAVLEEIRACGFNLAGFVVPEGLDMAAAAGLKAVVFAPHTAVDDAAVTLQDAEVAARIKVLMDKTAAHPAAFGYHLRDEPNAGLFPTLAKFSAAVRAAAPKALPYINLYPNYASRGQLGVSTYEQYLEQFVQTVKPSFLSYDHYALMADGTLRDGYFQNLEAVRAAALKHKLPFWNIVLAVAHFDYAEPYEAGLSFQAYTTLAYGGRGISYFTYFAPKIGNYRLSAIDQFGHKTPTWDMMRRVNLQIRKLAPTYLTLKSINVFHHPNVPAGGRGLDSSQLLAGLEGGDLMAGEFEGPGGQPFVMVVNKDLHRSACFGVTFKKQGPVKMVNSYTGQNGDWVGENNWLAPGQGMLLFVETPKQ